MSRLIGVTQRVDVHAARQERRDALDQRWYGFVESCGGIAIPIPNAPSVAINLAETLDFAGIIFTGGNDLSDLGGNAPERDATEGGLLSWSRSHAVPTLGVCRGMQMLAHYFGSTLERREGHAGTRHNIVCGDESMSVNSYHNWCVIEPPLGFVALARAPDGTVEAMRHVKEPVVGIMWHPEREEQPMPADIRLLRNLFRRES